MTASRETRLHAGGVGLYVREVGSGPPMVVLHGGPDFSHDYLLPEMDLLAHAVRLVYYDQRGRGRSGAGVEPEDVTLASEMEDLEALRRHLGVGSFSLLGHSWGGLLAMEYAIKHPGRVSRLTLMNPAPASRDDFMLLRLERRRTAGDDLARMQAIAATRAYASGDPEADRAYYRIHFRKALAHPEQLERLVASLRPGMTAEGIVRARAIEARLYAETWLREDYDLHPALAALRVPTLVFHGDRDLIPVACAEHIAHAIPGARLAVLEECGHFAYLERPREVRALLMEFMAAT